MMTASSPGETILNEQGRLVGYLNDRLSARILGVPTSGNGRRQDYSHVPHPRMRITGLAAGQDGPQDIIAMVAKGLYVSVIGGGSVDITKGDFNFQVEEAFLIEDGRLTTPVRGACLIGNGAEVMRRITRLGNDLLMMRRRAVREVRPGDASRARLSDHPDLPDGGRREPVMSAPQALEALPVDDAVALGLSCLRQAGCAGGFSVSAADGWEVKVRDGRAEMVKSTTSHSLHVTVYASEGRTGSMASGDCSPAGIRAAVGTACDLAAVGDPDPWSTTAPVEESGLAQDPDIDDPDFSQFTSEQGIALVARDEQAARDADPRVCMSDYCSASAQRSSSAMVSTTGVRVDNAHARSGFGIVAIAKQGEERQISWRDTSAHRWRDLRPPTIVGQKAAAKQTIVICQSGRGRSVAAAPMASHHIRAVLPLTCSVGRDGHSTRTLRRSSRLGHGPHQPGCGMPPVHDRRERLSVSTHSYAVRCHTMTAGASLRRQRCPRPLAVIVRARDFSPLAGRRPSLEARGRGCASE